MRLGREGDKETQTEKNREREIESDSERDRERERQTDRQRGSNHLQSADVTEHCNRRLLSLICRRIGAFRFPCLLLNITERQVTLHEDSNSPSLTQSTYGLSLEDLELRQSPHQGVPWQMPWQKYLRTGSQK